MRTKFLAVSFIVLAALLSALGYIFYSVHGGSYDGLFIAAPKMAGLPSQPIKSIEEVNEEKFMLTYENTSEITAGTEYSQYEAVLVGTNYTNPYVMKRFMRSGGFFTKDAQENKHNTVVLNEKAAFDIFGDVNVTGCRLYIGGNPYVVVGVMSDGDGDNRNIYVPATCFGETADAFMCAVGASASEEYVRNVLKQSGVTDTRYDMVNLGFVGQVIERKFILALGLIACGILLFTLRGSFRAFRCRLERIREFSKQYYFPRLIFGRPGDAAALTLNGAFIAAVLGALFMLCKYIFEIGLNWANEAGRLPTFAYDCFVSRLQPLQSLSGWSDALFAAFALVFVLVCVAAWE